MPNTRISSLSAGGSVSPTDKFVVVETAGVGPVTKTGAQLKTWASPQPNLNIFNVQSYGATGDGSTDDLASINSAISAMTTDNEIEGILYFPLRRSSGAFAIYNVSGPVVIGNGTKRVLVDIISDEMVNTNWPYTQGGVLVYTGTTGNLLEINIAENLSMNVTVRSLAFNCDSSSDGACIRTGGGRFAGLLVENVSCVGGAYNLHLSTGVVNLDMDNCWFSNSTVSAMRIDGSLQNAIWHHCNFEPCEGSHVQVSTGAGFPIEGSEFSKCVFEGAQGHSFEILPGGRGFRGCLWTNCWWEANDGDMFNLNNGDNVFNLYLCTFVACHFIGHSLNDRHVFHLPEAVGGANNYAKNLAFINCDNDGMGTNSYILKCDVDIGGGGGSHFETVYEVGAQFLGTGTTLNAFRAKRYGEVNMSVGFTPDPNTSGYRPPFTNMHTAAVVGGIPLEIWSPEAKKATFHLDDNGTLPLLYTGGDVTCMQLPNHAGDPISGWGASEAGMTWFNTTTGKFRGWTGSAAVDLA